MEVVYKPYATYNNNRPHGIQPVAATIISSKNHVYLGQMYASYKIKVNSHEIMVQEALLRAVDQADNFDTSYANFKILGAEFKNAEV